LCLKDGFFFLIRIQIVKPKVTIFVEAPYNTCMLKPAEIYKGIEFVRISQLPAEQQEKLKHTIKRDKIIKILIDNILVNDCVQYPDYKAWFMEIYPAKVIKSLPTKTAGVLVFNGKTN
jgi:hypothetical protein